VSYSITVKTSKALHKVIAAISEEDWTPIRTDRRRRGCGRDDLPALLPKHPEVPPHRATGEATPGSQLALFSTYDYHAFITDLKASDLPRGRSPPPRRRLRT